MFVSHRFSQILVKFPHRSIPAYARVQIDNFYIDFTHKRTFSLFVYLFFIFERY